MKKNKSLRMIVFIVSPVILTSLSFCGLTILVPSMIRDANPSMSPLEAGYAAGQIVAPICFGVMVVSFVVSFLLYKLTEQKS